MESPKVLRLFFDYVDPASFLLERRIRKLAAGSTLALEPFEMRTPPDPLLDPEEPEWQQRMDGVEREMAAEGYALARPGLVPWTRKAHELAIFANEHGCFRKVHDALFEAYLLEGRDIGRVDVLVELAARAGLDRMEAKAVLDVDRNRPEVEARRERALAAGVTRVPTLQLAGSTLEGLPDATALELFLRPLQAEEEP